MNIETIQTIVSIFKDIFTCLAALTAAGTGTIVAILGFRTWKKQLHWKTQYELAQRLLRAAYKVRDAISYSRFPLLSEDEIGEGMKDVSVKADAERAAVYKGLLQNVEEAVSDLSAIALEAESVWGGAVKESLLPLISCIDTLSLSFTMLIGRLEGSPHTRKIGADFAKIIWRSPYYTDSFSKQVEQAIRQIENFLKPYLKI